MTEDKIKDIDNVYDYNIKQKILLWILVLWLWLYAYTISLYFNIKENDRTIFWLKYFDTKIEPLYWKAKEIIANKSKYKLDSLKWNEIFDIIKKIKTFISKKVIITNFQINALNFSKSNNQVLSINTTVTSSNKNNIISLINSLVNFHILKDYNLTYKDGTWTSSFSMSLYYDKKISKDIREKLNKLNYIKKETSTTKTKTNTSTTTKKILNKTKKPLIKTKKWWLLHFKNK